MYNNNSDFYTHCCCYPENWNDHGEKDERYYRDNNHSQCDNWENNRKGNDEKFNSYGRNYCCNCLNCKTDDGKDNDKDYDRKCNYCCCNNFCRENKEEEKKEPRPEKRSCGCCLCKIFRICR